MVISCTSPDNAFPAISVRFFNVIFTFSVVVFFASYGTVIVAVLVLLLYLYVASVNTIAFVFEDVKLAAAIVSPLLSSVSPNANAELTVITTFPVVGSDLLAGVHLTDFTAGALLSNVILRVLPLL